MILRETIDVTIDVEGDAVLLLGIPIVVATESDPGCRTLPNGDPGNPPSGNIDITIDLSNRDITRMVAEVVPWADLHGVVEKVREAVLDVAPHYSN